MRIAVMIIFLMQQRMADAEFMQHGFIGVTFAVFFQDGFADKLGGHLLVRRQIIGERKFAVVIHRRINRQTIGATEIVVVLTMAGRDMDKTRAGVAGDKIGGEKLDPDAITMNGC